MDIIGDRYGKLTVLEFVEKRKRRFYYLCKCDCGNTKIVSSNALRTGNTRSCGCLAKDSLNKMIAGNIKHNKTHSRIYYIYKNIKSRCYNKNFISYKNYGARGIKMSDEWLGKDGFNNFYMWAIKNGYKEIEGRQCTIDRINNDGDYCPSNCRWTTAKVQSNNTRRNIKIMMNDKQQTLMQWCEEYNKPYDLVYSRIRKGVDLQTALNLPKNYKLRYYNYEGGNYSLNELSKMFNIKPSTLYSRLNQGKMYKGFELTAKGKIKK